MKVLWSEMSQRRQDTAMQVLCVHGPWLRSNLCYRAGTIFADTSEVQRNIIAQRALGLPC